MQIDGFVFIVEDEAYGSFVDCSGHGPRSIADPALDFVGVISLCGQPWASVEEDLFFVVGVDEWRMWRSQIAFIFFDAGIQREGFDMEEVGWG